MPEALQGCFFALFQLLRGVGFIASAAQRGWHNGEPGTGPGSITVFVGDYYALVDWYKLRFAEGLPYLLKTRQGTLSIPGLPRPYDTVTCAAAACWDLCRDVAKSLATTPQGRVATALVDSMPDDGQFDRHRFIDVVYKLQLDEPLTISFPKTDGFAEQLATILRSDEARAVERRVRERLSPLPIHRLGKEMEWEFGQAVAAMSSTSPPAPAARTDVPEPDPPPPVFLQGQGKSVRVCGKEKAPLTQAQYNVVSALLQAGSDGLTKDTLVQKSGHTDAVKIVKRLAEKDADWKAVLGIAGKAGGGYRILGLPSGPH